MSNRATAAPNTSSAHRGRSVLLAALAVLLALTGCADPKFELTLLYPDQAAFERADFVRVFVGESQTCDQLEAGARARLAFDPHSEEPEVGDVKYGEAAFFATAQDQACVRFLQGCVKLELKKGESQAVRLFMRPVTDLGC